MSEIKLTLKMKQLLEEELRQLKEEELPRILKDIEEARLLGDLSENAEYDMAMDEQALVYNRIIYIEKLLASDSIVTP